MNTYIYIYIYIYAHTYYKAHTYISLGANPSNPRLQPGGGTPRVSFFASLRFREFTHHIQHSVNRPPEKFTDITFHSATRTHIASRETTVHDLILHTGVCETNTPSAQALAIQSCSRSCAPASDLVFSRLNIPGVFCTGGMILFTDTGI